VTRPVPKRPEPGRLVAMNPELVRPLPDRRPRPTRRMRFWLAYVAANGTAVGVAFGLREGLWGAAAGLLVVSLAGLASSYLAVRRAKKPWRAPLPIARAGRR